MKKTNAMLPVFGLMLLMSFASFGLKGQSIPGSYERVLGSRDLDEPYSMYEDEGGNLIIGGMLKGMVGIVKLNSKCDSVWTLALDSLYTNSFGVLSLGKGNSLLAASYQNGSNDIAFIKVNASGQVVWARSHAAVYIPGSSALLPNGDIVIVGTMPNTYGDSTRIFFERLDSLGIPEFVREYKMPDNFQASKVIRTVSGTLLLAGATRRYNVSPVGGPVALIKFNELGDTLFSKKLSYNSGGGDIIQTADGKYMCAYDSYFNNRRYESNLAKLDTNANVMWTHAYSDPLYSCHVIQRTNGTFELTGTYSDTSNQGASILNLDANGLILQQQSVFNRISGGFSGLLENANGQITFMGIVNHDIGLATVESDFYVLKTNPDQVSVCQPMAVTITDTIGFASFVNLRLEDMGNQACLSRAISTWPDRGLAQYVSCTNVTGIKEDEKTFFRLFPNPANEYAWIEGTGSRMQTIELLNMQAERIGFFKVNTDREKLNLPEAPGIYFVRITFLDGSVGVQKIVRY